MSANNFFIQRISSLDITEKFGLVLLAGLFIFLTIFSLRCNVIYYDSYEYLNNAREIIGIHTRYDIPRSPTLPIILLPFVWLAKILDYRPIMERLPYFMMLIMGTSTLLIMWQMLRDSLPKPIVTVSVLALAFNTLYLHYWIFIMPEILACFFLVVYWQAVSKKHYLFAAIILGLIFNLRYQLLPLGLLGFFYSIITEKSNWRQALKNWTFVAFISIGIILLFHFIAIVLGAKINFNQGFLHLTDWLDNMYLGVTYKKERGGLLDIIRPEAIYLFHFVTIPILLLSLLGIIKATYRRENLDWLFILWFWGVYLPLGFIVEAWRKEARYFIVILPPIYYFFAIGLNIFLEYLKKLLQKSPPKLQTFLIISVFLALLINPILKAQEELFRLYDKSYTQTTGKNLAKVLKPKLLENNKPVFWAGSYYTIAPDDYLFSVPEKFFFFNFFSNGLSFYIDRSCFFNYTEPFVYQNAVGSYIVVNRNPCRDCGVTTNPTPQIPLTVHKVENQTKYFRTTKTFSRSSGNISTNFTIFQAETGKELYLSELGDILFIDGGDLRPNTILQFINVGERLPFWPKPSFWGLPNQVPLTPDRKIANIEFILVSEISSPIGEVL